MAYTVPTLTPSGTTFAQFQAGGPAGQLARLIAAQAATAAPGAPTVSATGGGSSGGNLPAGTVYVKVTESNGIGETTPSSEASATIAAGNIPQVTFAALQTGNVSRNVYVGTATGAEVLYAAGVTAGTYNLSAAIPTNSYAVAVPTANSTGLSFANAQGQVMNTALQYLETAIRSPKNLSKAWDDAVALLAQFNRGEPIPFKEVTQKLRHSHVFFAAMTQAFAEIGALIDANPGHFTTTQNGIGNAKTVRAWP